MVSTVLLSSDKFHRSLHSSAEALYLEHESQALCKSTQVRFSNSMCIKLQLHQV